MKQGVFIVLQKRSCRRAVAVAINLLALAAYVTPAWAADGTFTSATGGDWSTAGNWNPGVPGNASSVTTADNATFSGSTTYTVYLAGSSAQRSIQNIFVTNTGSTTLLGGTSATAVNETLYLYGGITINSGTVTIGDISGSPTRKVDIKMGSSTIANNSSSLLTIANGLGSRGTGSTTTITIGGTGNTLVSGQIGITDGATVALTKSGAGTLTLSGGNTYAGATTISSGTLKLTGANGTVTLSSSVTITSATLLLDNTSAANNLSRLNNSGTVTMNSGTFLFSNDAGSASFAELAGTLSIATGLNVVSASQAASGQTSLLTFAGLTRTAGVFVNFGGTGLGADNRNRIRFSATPTLGAWATVNSNDFAAYDGTLGITTSYSDIDHGGSITAGAATNVRINGGTSGSITLNFGSTGSISTLLQNTGTAGTVDTVGKTLQTSGMMIGSGMGSLTIGAAVNDGTLMSNAAGGDLILINNSVNALTINAVIANNTSASPLIKAGTGVLTLAGANTYTGSTAIQNGTLQVNTGSNLGTTTATVTMGTGAAGVLGTVGNLTLNDNGTIGALTVQSNTSTTTGSANINQLTIASGKTLTIGGTLTVGLAGNALAATKTALGTGAAPGAGGALTVNGNVSIGVAYASDPPGTGVPATVVDLSGLSNLSVTSTGTGYFRVGYGWQDKATLTLANNNTINVGTISVADGAGSNYNLAGFSTLNLGAGANVLQAPNIVIGQAKGAGIMQFATITGSVTIAGANGSGTANILIGNANVGAVTYHGTGTNGLYLAGHMATVNAGTVTVGSMNAGYGNNLLAAVTFDTGTFTANSIELAVITGGAKPSTGTFTLGADAGSTGVLNVSGGHFYLAKNAVGTLTATGSFIIKGGTANINCDITDASTAGTSVTTLTLNGGTLDMTGHNIGGASKAIGTLNFQAGTLMNVGSINGTGGLTKTTTGTLTLAGTSTYGGATTVTAGSLLVNGTLSGTGTVTVSSGLLGGTGVVAGLIVVDTGTLSPGNSVGTLTASSSVTLNGGAVFLVELSNDQSDLLQMSGGTTLTLNNPTLALAPGLAGTAGSFTVISGYSAKVGTFSNSTVTDGNGTQYDIVVSDTAVTLTVIPEPFAAGLLLLGLGALLFRRRRNDK